MSRKCFGRGFFRRGCVSNHGRAQTKQQEKDYQDGERLKRGRSGWHKAVTASVRTSIMGGQEK